MDERDLLVTEAGSMVIRAGTFATGPSLHQEVVLLLLTCQGEWRHDPLAGCNLVRQTNKRIVRSQLERIVRLQCERDGKPWATIREGINTIARHGA